MKVSHSDPVVKSDLSAALLQANERLLQRRREEGVRCVNQPKERTTVNAIDIANQQLHVHEQRIEQERRPIGWFDPLKQQLEELEENVTVKDNINEDAKIDIDIEISLHPSIAVELLQQEKVAVGRLWLLARSMDGEGKGCVDVEALRSRFTDKQNGVYLCGWRRIRMLLEQGEGLFWDRDEDDRLWLYQPGRVAVLLGLDHVEGVSVLVNVKQLLDIQSCRAHFYASWFSGRKTTNPISRAVLTRLTGVSEERQRLYEKIAHVDVTPCIAIGERYERDGLFDESYKRGAVRGHGGGVVFEFVDYKGKRGECGQSYIAWHLPNRYAGTHRQAGKSSRRKINRYLKRRNILEKKLTLGNVDDVDEKRAVEVPVRVFFDGAKAAQAVRKQLQTADEVYWDGCRTKPAVSDIYDVLPIRLLQGGVMVGN